MKNRIPGFVVAAVLVNMLTGCCRGGGSGGDSQLIVAERFELSDVRLHDGPFRDAQERDRSYLLSLDPDRFLHMFRVTSGLKSDSRAYGGWESENIEVRGQTLGHYLSSVAMMYAATGDERLLEKGRYTVNAIRECQEAFGSTGYCMAFPESFFDRLERGEPVWAPYYTFHKLLAGMIDQYRYAGNGQALEVATDLAGWVMSRTGRLDSAAMQAMLENEHGGMAEALADLYGITGNESYFDLARRFEHKAVTVPLSMDSDALLGRHANTQIPKLLGSARMYELTGEEASRRVAVNGYRFIEGVRTYVFGGFSNYEFFLRPPNILADQLSAETAESCCTHNLLKLADRLFTWTADVTYADYYERALVNHILASQDTATGMFMYYMALKPGHWKIYSTPDSSFWCCVGSGMENHATYGRSVYYHNDNDLYISQFIASELDWEGRGRVTQTTRFPAEEKTLITLRLRRPAEFEVKIRVPWWAGDRFRIKVNGVSTGEEYLPASWASVERKWRDGDIIEVEFPFGTHIERMPDDPSLFAVMNGPLVLAADLGSVGLDDTHRYLKNQRGMHRHKAPEITIPVFRPGRKSIEKGLIRREDGFSVFSTGELTEPAGVVLKPFYSLSRERYTIYFRQADYIPLAKPWDLD